MVKSSATFPFNLGYKELLNINKELLSKQLESASNHCYTVTFERIIEKDSISLFCCKRKSKHLILTIFNNEDIIFNGDGFEMQYHNFTRYKWKHFVESSLSLNNEFKLFCIFRFKECLPRIVNDHELSGRTFKLKNSYSSVHIPDPKQLAIIIKALYKFKHNDFYLTFTRKNRFNICEQTSNDRSCQADMFFEWFFKLLPEENKQFFYDAQTISIDFRTSNSALSNDELDQLKYMHELSSLNTFSMIKIDRT